MLVAPVVAWETSAPPTTPRGTSRSTWDGLTTFMAVSLPAGGRCRPRVRHAVGMAPTRWGIAGLGRIAALVAGDFPHVPDAELVAVGSRSPERAEAFAREHGARRAHGSYAELIADPEVDVVYIATPHPQHFAIALAAIRAGKGVLVEKAFTATLAGAEQLVAEARA